MIFIKLKEMSTKLLRSSCDLGGKSTIIFALQKHVISLRSPIKVSKCHWQVNYESIFIPLVAL